jgi:RHS repeat-associated protein
MAQPSINIDRFKVIAYQYDLISGKVNQVHYQPGMTDQLYHRYEYDAENRLTDVYIIDRKELIGIPVLEEHDARYKYYKHGPLARTVLGQQMVQGIDYAYTLQGWLKGVNSDTLTDGDATASAIDAYRFSLNYFNGDYNAIGSSVKSIVFAGHSAHLPDGDYRPLFNGNISSMVVGIPKLGETRLYNYGYDQLNRLTKMDAWTGYNTATYSWGTLNAHDGAYKERIAYDGNGNILKYLRNGYQGKESMDSLSYKYNRDVAGSLKNNKLRHIRDAVSDGQYTEDIDSQADDNYSYDPIGNLIKDTKDSIDNITWTVYGKIKKIEKTNGTDIVYTYDPGGNRISKSVISGTDTTITWYVRDAQGNPMGVYSGHYGTLTLNEHHLYGSSRLGIWNRNLDMLVAADPNNGNFVRGYKFFELTNHLGNVLVTISDRKFGHDGGGGMIDYYNSDVVNATDYYPFGMLQPGRKFTAGSLYRYGFNGKENDNDVKGEGNEQDYGMRIYDPRVGRFLSMDPLTKKYPWYTPYQFAGNKVIEAVDLDGAEESYAPGISHQRQMIQMGLKREQAQAEKRKLNPTGAILPPTKQQPEIMDPLKAGVKAQNAIDAQWAESREAIRPENLGRKLGVAAKDFVEAPFREADEFSVSLNAGRYAEALEHGKNFALSVAPYGGGLLKVGKLGTLGSLSEVGASEGTIIGLGLDEDLLLHRGTGAITYKNAGWQQAGLTKIDWGKASIDNYAFKESFMEAAQNAKGIRFEVANFDPKYPKPGITNAEFDHILSSKPLLGKTEFVRNGSPVIWNGQSFIKK